MFVQQWSEDVNYVTMPNKPEELSTPVLRVYRVSTPHALK